MIHEEELLLVEQHFPHLTSEQKEQLALLFPCYSLWNSRINVISRKDIEHLYLHHVLHSLSIAKVVTFRDRTVVVDVGTGGGFPGVPLAILFPQVSFVLIDSIRKKLSVVEAVAKELGLTNIQTIHSRAEEVRQKAHFVVSRAAMSLKDLVASSRHLIDREEFNSIPNGILCLKGGDLKAEVAPFAKQLDTYRLSLYFPYLYFEEKQLLHLPIL